MFLNTLNFICDINGCNFSSVKNIMKTGEMTSSEKVHPEGESVSSCVNEDLTHSFEVVLKDLPQVLSYIQRLNDHIKKQQNTMIKLYEKLKEYKSCCVSLTERPGDRCDASTQTEWNEATDVNIQPTPSTGDFVSRGLDEGVVEQPCQKWGTSNGQGNLSNLAEEVKQAAESAMQQTGFVYEEVSGMYYDYNTGYYYNAELGLYYDGQTGCYMYYNEETKTYEYHSEAATIQPEPIVEATPSESIYPPGTLPEPPEKEIETDKNYQEDPEVKRKGKHLDTMVKSKKIRADSPARSEGSLEEGECSDSNSSADNALDESDGEDIAESPKSTKPKKCKILSTIRRVSQDSSIEPPIPERTVEHLETDEEASSAWPPCMRIIVQSTEVPKLSVGTLFIVTCTGGTLGREKGHEVCIPDINISKHHGIFTFKEDDGGKYYLTDYGSRNGTYVDNKRLSVAKQESEPCEVAHGSVVTLGSTQLLCHIHPGRETCPDCEPGVVAAKIAEEWASSNSITLSHESRQTLSNKRKQELRRLRTKFGLGANEFRADVAGGNAYEDRAEVRRQTVGSDNEFAKTETASTMESIKSTNKGFKMLEKMGWSDGQSLGRDGTGRTEPVLVEQRARLSGLGSDVQLMPEVDSKTRKKTALWMRTQKRFGEVREQDNFGEEEQGGDED